MHIIIDGYNLIRQSEHLRRAEKFTLEEGRHSLIRFLIPYRERKGHRLTVVFDGWDGGSFREERDREGGIDIIYSRKGEKADDLIKRMAERSGDELVVVTSDRDIGHFVERCGGTVVTSQIFEGIVAGDHPPSPLPSYGHGSTVKKDDDLGQGTKGTKKKGPAKKTSRRERDYNKRLVKL
ncbi:MAG: NYN domain-containing protein [Syntrophales bacterium]